VSSAGGDETGAAEGFPEEELFLKGSAACAGCPGSMALRVAFKALGRNTLLVVIASCTSVLQSPFPYSALGLPTLNMAFATGGATGAGVSGGGRLPGEEGGPCKERPTVLVWAGDGGTYDIGIQALSGAAERGDDFIYVCYNNEAYSNTGTQRSGATPYAAWTSNTITGKKEWRKDVAQIMVAHDLPYVATASLAYPTDFFSKMRGPRSIRGTKLHRDAGALSARLEVPLRFHRQGEHGWRCRPGCGCSMSTRTAGPTTPRGPSASSRGSPKLVPVAEYLRAAGTLPPPLPGTGRRTAGWRKYQQRIDRSPREPALRLQASVSASWTWRSAAEPAGLPGGPISSRILTRPLSRRDRRNYN
jgi:hypothetical protein